MGFQPLRATCKCGFEIKGISYGCTMIMCAKGINYFPALCNTCGEINGVNEKEKPITCSKCFSTDIRLYGGPSMLGSIVEADVDSKHFYRCYELWIESLEMMAKSEGEPFVPISIDEYRVGFIERHNESIQNAENPIFSHYNYCPSCKDFRLRYFQPAFGLHFD